MHENWEVSWWYIPYGCDYVAATVCTRRFESKEEAEAFARPLKQIPEMAIVYKRGDVS